MPSTVVVGSGTVGSKFIRTEYPVTEGLIAGSTKQSEDPDLEENC